MNVHKVEKWLKENKLEALLISNPIDLYYVTGEEISSGNLVVEQKGATLFVDGRYYEKCLFALPELTVEKSEAFYPYVKGKKLAFDSHSTSFAAYEMLAKSGCTLKPVAKAVTEIRSVKEKREMEAIVSACRLAKKGFSYLSKQLKTGIEEIELARKLELFFLKHGGEGLAFKPIIAFGENSAYPHYRSGKRKLKQGDIVLIDMGVVMGKYHSDMTRTLFFGKKNRELVEAYNVVRRAFDSAVAAAKPKVTGEELDKVAREVIVKAGFGEYFTHSLGHGVGLEIHELPVLKKGEKKALLPNMVITIEPGIYIPGLGGIRWEDTFLVTEKGVKNLTGT